MTDPKSVREEIVRLGALVAEDYGRVRANSSAQTSGAANELYLLALRLAERVEALEAHSGKDIIRNLQQSVRLLTEERDEARRERNAARLICERQSELIRVCDPKAPRLEWDQQSPYDASRPRKP